jgi:hypothetical protein
MARVMAMGGLALALLAGLFVLTGGVYKTVNLGGGSVYLVNRFTGRTQLIKDGAVQPVISAAAQAREQREARARAEAKRRWQSAHDVAVQMAARSAEVVGDPSTHLYHRFASTTGGVLADSVWDDRAAHPHPASSKYQEGVWRLLQKPDWQDSLRVCSALVSGASFQYFGNELAATKQDYWPCSECNVEIHTKTKSAVTTRDWADPDAPASYEIGAGEDVSLVASAGDYVGVSSMRKGTGERTVCWIPRSAVVMKECTFCNYFGYTEESGHITSVCDFCRGTHQDPYP